MSLTQLANKYGTDKGDQNHEAHNYTPVYESYIKREEPICLLEIGCNDPRFPGASLYMWEEYLTNDFTQIIGLDIDPPFLDKPAPKTSLVQADQSSPSQLLRVFEYPTTFDFIIDDGLHTFDCQINSFLTLFPFLVHGGVYFIEDCHAKDCHRTIELFETIQKTTPSDYSIERIIFNNNKKLITVIKK